MNAAVDVDRRRFLIQSTTALAALGIGTSAVPLLASWQPTAAAKLSGRPVSIDVGKLRVGEGLTFLWRGTPISIVRRDPNIAFESLRDQLKDPDSIESEQPEYARNAMRARRADVLVLTAVCTHLQCIPALKSNGDVNLGRQFSGGFVCACHNSRYDLAGRVLKGSPAPTNLPVPAHYFADDNTLIVGADA